MKTAYNIKERLVKTLSEAASKRFVEEVRIGLTYTAVKPEGGECGVAYTFLEAVPRGGMHFPDSDFLAGRKASELLTMLSSDIQLEHAVGLAAANALANQESNEYVFGDSRKAVNLRSTDTVGMVGHFEPLVPEIQSRVKKLLIFEIEDRFCEGFFSPEEAKIQLPECDAAIITATSIVNDTMDGLLSACENCREVVILGASTPLVPQAFAQTPVTLLSGIVVTDSQMVLKVVSEGGGMRRFRQGMRKVNLRL